MTAPSGDDTAAWVPVGFTEDGPETDQHRRDIAYLAAQARAALWRKLAMDLMLRVDDATFAEFTGRVADLIEADLEPEQP